MGMYAQTNFEITCDNNKTAEKVAKKLKAIPTDENYNSAPDEVEVGDSQVFGFMCSGRYQNLEYQCERAWEAIKDIKGVKEMSCPFLSEADGQYFTNED